ncbi:MAG: hypothetical protein JWO25_1238 [Alphaproteobacteria bacterium]|nr:hypothetical protein [Alphaproteobacteria bacterium]
MEMLGTREQRRQTPEARRRAARTKGYHLPAEERHQRPDGLSSSTCRYCGCALVRGIGRYWIFSGEMG